MSRTLLHDWECSIEKNRNNTKELLKIAEDIYNTAYARGKASEERPQGDLISRSELKTALCEFMKNNIGIYSNEMFYLVDSIPTVERPQGKWILQYRAGGDEFYTCSLCERVIEVDYPQTLKDFPFCHCGADMRGEEE